MMDHDEVGAVGGMIDKELGENLPQCHFTNHKSHMTWNRARTGDPDLGGRRLPELWHGLLNIVTIILIYKNFHNINLGTFADDTVILSVNED
jgi:hypothetical protein